MSMLSSAVGEAVASEPGATPNEALDWETPTRAKSLQKSNAASTRNIHY